MYDNILIPTDGSDAVEGAVTHGLRLAETYDATVHALAVIDTAELFRIGHFGTDRIDFEETIEPLETEARAAVEAVTERAAERDVDLIPLVREGDPKETIDRYVADADVDLIVMATHGRTGLDRFLVGSLTEKVVRTADVPVLTVRGEVAERASPSETS